MPHFWATMQFGTVPYLSLPVVVLLLAALALAFDFTNGIHDAANSIATVVSTGVLKPQQAVSGAPIHGACAMAMMRSVISPGAFVVAVTISCTVSADAG